MEPDQQKPRWQRILELEARAKGLDPSSVETPESAAINRLADEQRRTNFLLALQPFVNHPFRIIMGGLALWIILRVCAG
jgi:hypothetical protein